MPTLSNSIRSLTRMPSMLPTIRLSRWFRRVGWWQSSPQNPLIPTSPVSLFREIGPDRLGEFLLRGFHQRHVFPHRLFYLRRGGSDGMQLARRIYGVSE